MKLLEYEAKDIFKEYGLPVPRRHAVLSLERPGEEPKLEGDGPWIIKAQVLAGGRGKAGGVKLAKTRVEAADLAKKMLGMKISTHQTHGHELTVGEVLVEDASPIAREIYISVVMDRKSGGPMVIASAEGGMSIEELAQSHPEKICKVKVDPDAGLLDHQARKLAFDLRIPRKSFCDFTVFAKELVQIFLDTDASLVEVNPLVVTKDDSIMAIDGKIVTDDNADFRHKDLAELPDREHSDIEKEAGEIGINYIGLDGNIGCMVNGAGLAMATLDTVKLAGGNAANFLDVGGGATVDQITKAFGIILKDPKVKAVLVNIFGGIMKCDNIATGVVEASKRVGIKVPLIVRLEGTNVREGKEILAKSGLVIEQADSLWEAAQKVVKAAK